MRKGLFTALLAGAVLAAAAASAQAQSFPSKPIRIIVPFSAGGGVDLLARIISQEFQKQWGQPAVVENKPGAGGNIGTDFVAKSAPDGYTLLLGTATLAITPFISKALPFDVQKDLAPVAMLNTMPFMVAVNPELPVKSIAELIAYAKANPGKLSYGSPGIGTPHHLAMELFKTMTGTFMLHIAYRGSAPSLIDLITGQVQVAWFTIAVAISPVNTGKVRGLATSEAKRLALFKDIPAVAETLPGFEVGGWYAVFAPNGTSASVIQQLSAELQRIYREPKVIERLAPLGYEPAVAGPGPLAATLASDLKKWEKVVRDAAIKPE